MTYLLFTVALALSAVAGWYAIAGLIAIFAASVIPIAIMGSLLEVSKLVVASWLYRSWKHIPFLMKSYFTIALITLMLLTSMGIFGFLSKAHLDQAVPTGDLVAKLEMVDEKIKIEKESIDVARKNVSQLDRQVEETLNRTATSTNNAAVNRSITIRNQQAKERAALAKQIETSQAKISQLNEERTPIAAEVRKVEAEVGPLKYIAELIYGEEAKDGTLLEKAVRFVILMIVFVFDPLAVLMLVAANWQLRKDRGDFDPPKVISEAPKEPTIQKIVEESHSIPTPLPEESKQIIKKFFKDKVRVEDKIRVEPVVHSDTIVEAVDDLQHGKNIDFDSLGRRITPV
jgi:hypothetical protein